MYEHYTLFNRFCQHIDEFCAWGLEFNIIKRPDNCHVCNAQVGLHCTISEELGISNTPQTKHSGKWICASNKVHQTTIFHESIFFNSKMPFENILILMYGFIHDWSYSDIKRETMNEREISSATICFYYKLFREILFYVVQNIKNEVGLLGNRVGAIVEVDESIIGNRKYNRGRFKHCKWIIGIIERNTNNVRFEYVKTRDAETLFNILKKYVSPNATIITDCWKGYIGLDTYFRRHQTVNHSKNFISPETGAHTQSIENQWHLIKKRIHAQHAYISENDKLSLCLSEYIYRYHYRNIKNNGLCVQFMSDVCKTFSENHNHKNK